MHEILMILTDVSILSLSSVNCEILWNVSYDACRYCNCTLSSIVLVPTANMKPTLSIGPGELDNSDEHTVRVNTV
jgi:hypothetical protein